MTNRRLNKTTPYFFTKVVSDNLLARFLSNKKYPTIEYEQIIYAREITFSIKRLFPFIKNSNIDTPATYAHKEIKYESANASAVLTVSILNTLRKIKPIPTSPPVKKAPRIDWKNNCKKKSMIKWVMGYGLWGHLLSF